MERKLTYDFCFRNCGLPPWDWSMPQQTVETDDFWISATFSYGTACKTRNL